MEAKTSGRTWELNLNHGWFFEIDLYVKLHYYKLIMITNYISQSLSKVFKSNCVKIYPSATWLYIHIHKNILKSFPCEASLLNSKYVQQLVA